MAEKLPSDDILSDSIIHAEKAFNQEAGKQLAETMLEFIRPTQLENRNESGTKNAILENLRASSPEVAMAAISEIRRNIGDHWRGKIGITENSAADVLYAREVARLEALENGLRDNASEALAA